MDRRVPRVCLPASASPILLPQAESQILHSFRLPVKQRPVQSPDMPFPRFEDGDVEIRFNSVDEPYILHSWVLALHSPWFKASLSDRWRSGTCASLLAMAETDPFQQRREEGEAARVELRLATDESTSCASTRTRPLALSCAARALAQRLWTNPCLGPQSTEAQKSLYRR